MGGYDRGMGYSPTNADLVRLRQFLKTLETDAVIEVGDIDLGGDEISIDYGTAL